MKCYWYEIWVRSIILKLGTSPCSILLFKWNLRPYINLFTQRKVLKSWTTCFYVILLISCYEFVIKLCSTDMVETLSLIIYVLSRLYKLYVLSFHADYPNLCPIPDISKNLIYSIFNLIPGSICVLQSHPEPGLHRVQVILLYFYLS